MTPCSKRRSLIGELSAEFLGTFVILIFGIGVVAQVVLYGGDFGNCVLIPFAWGWGVAWPSTVARSHGVILLELIFVIAPPSSRSATRAQGALRTPRDQPTPP